MAAGGAHQRCCMEGEVALRTNGGPFRMLFTDAFVAVQLCHNFLQV